MKTKKILSLFLSLLMVLSLAPQPAFAVESVCECEGLALCTDSAMNDCALCAADASSCLGKAPEVVPLADEQTTEVKTTFG